jgi:hypothetical protein
MACEFSVAEGGRMKCPSCTISYKCPEHAKSTDLKLHPQNQGKVIADYSGTWKMTKGGKVQVGEQWYTMFPDGTVQIFSSKKEVTRAAKVWFKKEFRIW